MICNRFQVQYLVKFQGYSNAENEWKWSDSLNCTDAIRKFELERCKGPNQRGRKRKPTDSNIKKKERKADKPGTSKDRTPAPQSNNNQKMSVSCTNKANFDIFTHCLHNSITQCDI